MFLQEILDHLVVHFQRVKRLIILSQNIPVNIRCGEQVPVWDNHLIVLADNPTVGIRTGT